MWSPPNNFNAINTDSSYGYFNVAIIFDTLVTFDEKVNFVPRLAEKWDVSADKTTFTFHLNPKAKWHDGTPVTAADVEFTIWAITHPKIESNRGANVLPLKGLKGSKRAEGVETVEGVKVVDDHTIQFITKNPVDPLFLLELIGTGIYIIPKHVLKDVPPDQFSKADFWMKPTVGAGPFKFVKYETGQFVEYTRNDDYYRGKPHLDKLIVSIVTPATMVAQLEKGEADMAAGGGIGDIPLDDWERVKALPNVRAYSYQDNGYQYMIINGDPSKVWADKRLRQALAYAINRQLIVDKLLKGQGIVSQGPIIPVTSYYNPKIEGKYPYDVEKAKALLKEAGWDANKEIALLVPTGNIVRELSADIIQANLAAAGVKVKIEKMDFPTLMARYGKGDFDLGLVGWGGVLDPDVRSQYQTGGQYNFGKASSKVLDELLEKGANTADTAERKKIYDEFQIQFLEEMPIVPLYWPLRLVAMNKRVNNASHMITTNALLRNMHEWWVSDGK
jgi:peptide/nickel transport system substrate-binding protein